MDFYEEKLCVCGREIADGDMVYMRDDDIVGCDVCIDVDRVHIVTQEEAQRYAEEEHYNFLRDMAAEERVLGEVL